MRSLIRWCAALGLAGSMTLGSLLIGALEALALTREQIIQQIGHVPVFTLTDAQGAPLVASQGEGQQATAVSGVFINRADAQRFLDNLRTRNPQIANSVRVTPVSLAEIYELATQENPQNRIQFSFVPSQQDLEAAQQVLRSTGGQNANQNFQGTPLFIARSSGQDGGYLTVRQGERQVVPLYFRREDLQAMIDRLRQQQPDMANRVTVQVTTLEGVIQMLQNSNNQQEMQMLFLVPPRESIEFIRNLQQQQGGQPQQRPAAGQQPQQRPAARQQSQQRPAARPQNQQRPSSPARP
ncbi:MAG TPA: hypothetical protein IGS37_02745 [Synechococcales cyanobacterium M55_K2018_004]|nr:hypothetical protein [Synechococcales cyanobacterium M55_K2018_004]